MVSGCSYTVTSSARPVFAVFRNGSNQSMINFTRIPSTGKFFNGGKVARECVGAWNANLYLVELVALLR